MVNVNLTPGLEKRKANYVPMTPLDFLSRAAAIYPDKVGVVNGERRVTWGQIHDRARALASGLERMGVGYGEVVSILSPNTPAMIEAHFGVPGSGAVLNTINIRLDAPTIAFTLDHAESQVSSSSIPPSPRWRAPPAARSQTRPRIVEIDDLGTGPAGLGEIDYESLARRKRREPALHPAAATSGTRSRSTIPAAPPATPRASSITIAAPI